MDAKKFGGFLAEMRKQKHMTQAELAAKIDVTDKAVSRWERGVGFPDVTKGDWSALSDTMGALVVVAVLFSVITVFLNVKIVLGNNTQ